MEQKLPLVSIVTPSYNAMPFLEANIKSILDQGYPHIEHLVMDGGSRDNTVEVLKSYPHITWVSEKDRGQSHALNKGFSRATGEIIGWLNADDTYTPGAIHAAVRYLLDNPDVDLVGTDVNIIDEHDAVIGYTRAGDFNVVDLLSFNMVKQPSVFMRRKVIDELEGLDEQYHYVMDQEFWLRVGLNDFKFVYLRDQVFANFRLIKGTKTFEASVDFHKEWQQVVTDVLGSSLKEHVPVKKKEEILSTLSSNIYLSKAIQGIEKKERMASVVNLVKACQAAPTLVFNRGTWKFFLLGALGLDFNKLNKFK